MYVEIYDEIIYVYFSTLYGKKSTFLSYRVKQHHFDTFKVMLLLSYPLRSIINLAHDFKSLFLDIEITIYCRFLSDNTS